MSITFRKLTDSDIDACLSILKENYPEEKDKHWADVLLKDINNVLNKAYPSDFFIVMQDGIIVGFGCWMEDGHPNVYSLTWINILPNEQGKGIGKALVCELEKIIAKEKKQSFHITLKTNKPMFYNKLGYKTVAKEGEDDVMARKFII